MISFRNIVLMAILLYTLNVSGQNKIDAVTGATPNMDIRVDSGFCYDSFAVLYLYYSDSFDKHFLMYGDDTTKFGDTAMVPNWPRNAICTLANLIPDSTYNFRYRGELASNPSESQYTSIGSMRTQSILMDTQKPSVSLLSPLAGDTVYVSANTTIKWIADDNIGISSLVIYQSDNDGVTWDSILDVTDISDSLEYSFSSTESNMTRLKIVAKDAAGLIATDSSAGSFILMAETENSNVLKLNTTQYLICKSTDNLIQFSRALELDDKIDILQLNGKLVLSELISHDGVDKVNLSGISTGTYIFRLVRNNTIISKGSFYLK